MQENYLFDLNVYALIELSKGLQKNYV